MYTGRKKTYATWKAGFIEDAEAVHLATKPMFAAVIASMLAEPLVKEAYVASTADGANALGRLTARVEKALGEQAVDAITAFKMAKPPEGNASLSP